MAKKLNGTIIFSFKDADIFNDVCLLSSFMAKNLAGSGASIDEICITDDEKDVYMVCMNQTLPNIYEAMLKMSIGEAAFNYAPVSGDVSFTITDNNEYNANVLSIVEPTLRDCIKYGVLTEFYSICLNADLFKISKDKFTANISLLNQRLFQLKKKAINSLM